MRTIEYADREIRPGAVLVRNGETLYVHDVVFRLGRGLELHTRRHDGYLGPVLYPHPDETMTVSSMPPVEDSWGYSSTDYPHARVMR